ncbi:hypothetical protein SEA_FUZZBUSTER_67 [Microbacterium phage FuzzBuster]|uniref:Uncharacterized protein n=1 Tax=Microbacterium phage FuzzBuster TaxID=2590935 RepID=A0A516KV43_9CAUD|nr:hypothetical protein SEA_FUZZBUSTER_67 [Microbacterium phage FuzzBuster]
MSKVKWSKVKRGDVVEAGGVAWTVEKIKEKGKRAKVTIRNGSRVAESKVLLADKVKLVPAPADETPRKARAQKPQRATATPPKPAHGDPWETRQDRIEKQLEEVLGARLAGESTDTAKGYYVPMPDVTNIASHLLFFHGSIPETARDDEGAMLAGHAYLHQLAEAGDVEFAVNHWHTEKRPTTGKKSKKKKG